MGKMRFKLSHVMPHAWFYKRREVGKPDDSHAYKAPETTRKSIYTSPINHKAIDIAFPADTPKRSPLTEPPLSLTEDFTALDQLHLVELSDECRPSIVLPHTSTRRLNDNIISFSVDGDELHGLSSVPDVNAGVATCGVTFDVRELERRLKNLGSEDRRKYYSTSPMLLPVTVPSPMVDDGMCAGVVATHEEALEYPSSSVCGANEFSLDVGSANEYLLDVRQRTNNEERSPLMNAVYQGRRSPLMKVVNIADDEKPFDGCVSIGDGLVDESNRHSTSSSDTGFERGSSSMWERDVFSITSDGSEAFTTTCADDVESMHKSSQRFRKLRDRMSPSLYATVHMQDSNLLRLCDDNQELGLAENGMMSGFCKDGHVANDTQDERGCVSHACDRPDAHAKEDVVHDESGLASYVCHSDERVRVVGGSKWSNYNSTERPSLTASPNKSFDFSSKHEGSVHRVTQLLSDYNDRSDSVSVQYGRNDSFSAQYKSRDNFHSEGLQISSGEFSYARCKERLLSSRTSFTRSRDVIMREREKEKISNYTKFKLKQRGFLHTKASAPSGGMYLDPGLYNNMSRGKPWYADDNSDSTDVDSATSVNTMPLRFNEHSKYAHSHRSWTSAYHSKSPSNRTRGIAGQIKSTINTQDQGQSWFKGTLRAVREKTRDPSFEQFSPSTSSTGGTPSAAERSRVFDSFAMVKCSYDPKQDFKESMVEMIMEKDLHRSHDMVELLQCYLTLNADGYHDIIMKVFTEVWSEMFQHV
eukprot:c19011_g1_i1 orf=316-2583(+)